MPDLVWPLNDIILEFDTDTERSTFKELIQERRRQDTKWGIQNHSPAEWISILAEEFGEAAQEANKFYFGALQAEVNVSTNNLHRAAYRKELIETAAVCLAAIENLDRDLGVDGFRGDRIFIDEIAKVDQVVWDFEKEGY